jgi:large-conductance mechanosensitive channel
MITFLLGEGILTIGIISSMFTQSMLASLKQNIIDPFSHRVAEPGNTDNFTDTQINKNIKWKMFIKDFVVWIIVMFIIYLIWKYIPNPLNKNITKM